MRISPKKPTLGSAEYSKLKTNEEKTKYTDSYVPFEFSGITEISIELHTTISVVPSRFVFAQHFVQG